MAKRKTFFFSVFNLILLLPPPHLPSYTRKKEKKNPANLILNKKKIYFYGKLEKAGWVYYTGVHTPKCVHNPQHIIL